mmetsp:Transcript_19258/g.56146  ORF Transcript_19258/g.56146 Transcript_19258/m.56146 type:complete len:248 (-) Transcript_19258:1514-2257(-)
MYSGKWLKRGTGWTTRTFTWQRECCKAKPRMGPLRGEGRSGSRSCASPAPLPRPRRAKATSPPTETQPPRPKPRTRTASPPRPPAGKRRRSRPPKPRRSRHSALIGTLSPATSSMTPLAWGTSSSAISSNPAGPAMSTRPTSGWRSGRGSNGGAGPPKRKPALPAGTRRKTPSSRGRVPESWRNWSPAGSSGSSRASRGRGRWAARGAGSICSSTSPPCCPPRWRATRRVRSSKRPRATGRRATRSS